MLPSAETEYLSAVTARLRELLGESLTGVYPTGSAALDGYRPGRSDLDLIAVAEDPATGVVADIAAALDHDALPCPAAGLEFVLYDRAALAVVGVRDGFALNLNTGRDLPPLVEIGPTGRPDFYFPIDRDITAQQGRSLTGPPFAALAPRLPADVLRPVVARSVAAGSEAPGADAVLNACRALRWSEQGRWAAKDAAGEWAVAAHPEVAGVVTGALEGYARGRGQGCDGGGEFLEWVLGSLEAP